MKENLTVALQRKSLIDKIKNLGEFNNWKGSIRLYLTVKEVRALKRLFGINWQNMSFKDIYTAISKNNQ